MVLILTLLVLVLYAKWIFCVLYYPLMALGALGQSTSNRKLSYVLRFPLRVAEHFLRFGGQICPISDRDDSFRSLTYMALSRIGCENGQECDDSLSHRNEMS